MNSSSSVLVIGSNSFSGSSYIRFLLDQGWKVFGCSRSLELHSVFLPYKNSNASPNFRFYQFDINKDIWNIIELVRNNRIEYVVNFAAQSMVAESWNSPADWFMTNTVSTIKLHDELRKCDFLKRL